MARFTTEQNIAGAKHTCLHSQYHMSDSKLHVANMGPIWGRQDPCGPHVGRMNFAIWGVSIALRFRQDGRLRRFRFCCTMAIFHLAENISLVVITIGITRRDEAPSKFGQICKLFHECLILHNRCGIDMYMVYDVEIRCTLWITAFACWFKLSKLHPF